MSAHRSFARLPSGIFHDLLIVADSDRGENDVDDLGGNHAGGGGSAGSADRDPERLRAALCSKLLRYFTAQTRAGGGGRVLGPAAGGGPPLLGPASSGPPAPATPAVSQVTAEQLLRMSPPAVLRALSPLLTAEECDELVRRVCDVCAARPSTALTILRQTHSIGERRQCRRQRRRRPLCGDGDNTDTPPGNVSDADADADTNSNEAFDNDRMRHLPSGTPKLDDCLRGGFRVGTVTELCGRAGVGKTQLCLQLCVSAARYGQGSVYVDSERKLSLRRLQEIASRRWEETRDNGIAADDVGDEDGFHYGNDPGDGEDGPHDNGNHRAKRRRRDLATRADEDGVDAPQPYRTPREVLENVTVHTPNTTDEMLSVVSGLEEEILLRNDAAASGNPSSSSSTTLPVRLVVLDSIAAPTKRDLMGGGPDSARKRVATIFKTAQMLKRLADQLRVAVVVVNQVGLLADGGGMGSETTADVGTDYVSVSASLGTSWHHCVTTRLLLEHERDPHRERTDADVAQEAANANVAATRGGGFAGGDDGDVAATERRAWMAERGRVRRATVRKSNVAGRASMFYEVTALGVCEI